jgi:uncharacterized membrane-anchored protein
LRGRAGRGFHLRSIMRNTRNTRKTLFLGILAASLATAGVASAKKKPVKAAPAAVPEAAAGPEGAAGPEAAGGDKAAADGPGDAEPSDAEIEAQIARAHADFESTLKFETGTISLVGGKVQLALPEGYRYLGPADTDKVLMKWGNPGDQKTEGMVLPKDESLWEQSSLAIIVEYVDDGHVSDDDAAKIDYTQLLQQMREGGKEDNAARKKAGLAEIALVGWAEPPHYDRATRKLYWAKELSSTDSDVHMLNYSVRVLGREGVLELDCLSSMEQLPAAKEEMQRILGFADFTRGNQYTDFKKGHDRVAEYGIAAVVAGGVAAKLIGTKGFFALLFAAKKFILLGLAAVAGFLKKFWSKITGQKPETLPQAIAVHMEKGPGES